jgi:hypothetical protein
VYELKKSREKEKEEESAEESGEEARKIKKENVCLTFFFHNYL